MTENAENASSIIAELRSQLEGELVSKKNMEIYWGERCEEYEPGCCCCEAWKRFDMVSNFLGDYPALEKHDD